jgi:DNA-binding transcriptional MerR regulator
MTLSHTSLWTLDELNAQVAQALAVDYAGAANGRIRDVPDIRTIRYYTTRGLIDRPAQMRGRTALYGERHLLQLVAIKRLQAQGLTLAEIQAQVVGQSDRKLRELARIPVQRPQAAEAEATEERREGRFWQAAPAPVPEGETNNQRAEEVQKNDGPDVRSLIGVALADGATLLLEASRPLDEQDVEALRSAAAPLRKILKLRRII